MLARLEGAPNFRGVAGQETAAGARVRGGRLFRSGDLHALTADDLAVVGALGIRLVCDLRGGRERTAWPDRWPASAAPVRIELTGSPELRTRSRRALEELLANPTVARARALMHESYRQFPLLLAAPLRAMFATLASDPAVQGGAILVHCAAGKDRTGFVLAMLLSAIGVRRTEVIEEYLRTGSQVALRRRIDDARVAVRTAAGVAPGDEVLAELAAVDAALLEASFAFVEDAFGTVDAYLGGPCGLSPAVREKVVQALTA